MRRFSQKNFHHYLCTTC